VPVHLVGPGVAEASAYSIEVSHWGEVNFSKAQLQASGWKVNLSV
jgi:hypothetical protein